MMNLQFENRRTGRALDMVNWTHEKLMEHYAKESARGQLDIRAVAKVSREDVLHDAIEAYCRSQGWLYVHSRMDRATTTKLGVWDFIVALPGGVTLWCECKRGIQKLTVAQQAFGAHLTKLGHRTVIARSLEDFVRATKDGFSDAMIAAGREG